MSLKLEHVYKAYGNVQAVSDATLHVEGKKFIVLAGPSGCGKTTLLHLIAGFLTCDEGKVYIDGQCMNHVLSKDRDIAMVFQDSALFPHMNVYDNIAIGLEYSGVAKDEVIKRVHEMAALVGVEDLLKRKAYALSNGQKQRVSIARALVRRPKLFLMDEPLSALDARLKSQLRIDIARLYQKMDATFLYITHDQMEAMTLADILIIMRDGKFMQWGSPMEIYHDPKNLFTASFLGKYEINCFQGKIKNNILLLEDKCWQLKEQVEDQDITIALRPEYIVFDDHGWQGEVILVENLGDDIYYHITWKENIILMKGRMQDGIHRGDVIRFGIDLEHIFYFDPVNEQRVYIK